jgi:putative transposase
MVTLYGTNEKSLFYDEADKQVFISIMKRCLSQGQFSIMGYCLLNKKIILILSCHEALIKTMNRFMQSYSLYYQRKYLSHDALFTKQIEKVTIETDKDFQEKLMVMHRLPCHQKLVALPSYYPYSSMNEYLLIYRGGTSWVDASVTLKLMPSLVDFKIAYEQTAIFN